MMKRLLVSAALVCATGLAAVAAPALSLRPYRPAPELFSLGAPGADGVSEPLRAPKRFNLVGLTWSRDVGEPRIAVRTRTDGGEWSRWAPLYSHAEDGPDPLTEEAVHGTSTPTWVGEADWVQYRSSKPLPGLRLRFVNVEGTATATDRLLNGVRRVANTAMAALAPTPAGAQTTAPDIVPRSAWGASECEPRSEPELGTVKTAFVHHTVNANDYTAAEAPDVVLGICLYHRNTNRWNDIGYNFLVDRFGTVYEGRAGGIDQPIVGAQAQGYNAQSTGIANLGTFTSAEQTPPALAAMARLIRWKLPLHGSPTAGNTTLISAGGPANRYPAGAEVALPRVAGHRDADATECPGDGLYAQLPELRRLVGSVTARGVQTRVSARGGTIDFGSAVTLTGRLSAAGIALPGESLEVQALVRGRWRSVGTPRTDSGGGFALSYSPARSRRLRVRFTGRGDFSGATSSTFTVAVRPVVRAARWSRRGIRARRYQYRGRVRPRKARLVQVLWIRKGRRWRKLGVRGLRTDREGRFEGSFVPRSGGLYSFYVVAKGDSVTARGVSRRYVVNVRSRRGGSVAARRVSPSPA